MTLSLLRLVSGSRRRLGEALLRPLFLSHGHNFRFDPNGQYSFSRIKVGDNVNLGVRPTLSATRAKITIGNNVFFGPEVSIQAGNHRTDVIGRFMGAITEEEKRPEDDQGVTIEDDVWVGTRAIILDGVTIRRGSVVGAGAVVTRDVPPYTVVGGVPARVLKLRFSPDKILEHEAIVYPSDARLSIDDLSSSFRTLQD